MKAISMSQCDFMSSLEQVQALTMYHALSDVPCPRVCRRVLQTTETLQVAWSIEESAAGYGAEGRRYQSSY